jgi:hypothetical protein
VDDAATEAVLIVAARALGGLPVWSYVSKSFREIERASEFFTTLEATIVARV